VDLAVVANRKKKYTLGGNQIKIIQATFSHLFDTKKQKSGKNSSKANAFITFIYYPIDRLCGLVVRVLGYRSGGLGSIPCTTKKK
jgi:hypothetical protein